MPMTQEECDALETSIAELQSNNVDMQAQITDLQAQIDDLQSQIDGNNIAIAAKQAVYDDNCPVDPDPPE